jgi:hypothetical protein
MAKVSLETYIKLLWEQEERMAKRKPASTNYGTATLRPWQRKDERREKRNIKRKEKREALRDQGI